VPAVRRGGAHAPAARSRRARRWSAAAAAGWSTRPGSTPRIPERRLLRRVGPSRRSRRRRCDRGRAQAAQSGAVRSPERRADRSRRAGRAGAGHRLQRGVPARCAARARLPHRGHRALAGRRGAAAAGHVVHALDIEAHELGLPRYSLITMTHVLEHLQRPVAGLTWIRRHLAPGGLAVIEVPNWGDGCGRCGVDATGRSSSATTSASSSERRSAGAASRPASRWSACGARPGEHPGVPEFAHGPRPRPDAPEAPRGGSGRGRSRPGRRCGGTADQRGANRRIGLRRPSRRSCSRPWTASIRRWNACSAATVRGAPTSSPSPQALGLDAGAVPAAYSRSLSGHPREGGRKTTESDRKGGVVVKSVITPACHAGGRGFESRPPRPESPEETPRGFQCFNLPQRGPRLLVVAVREPAAHRRACGR
jgi:hypothetical protein